MLAVKYIRAIWGAAREHGVDQDGVYESIRLMGKAHVRDLTAREAVQLIDGIRGRGWTSKDRRAAAAQHGRRDTAVSTHYIVSQREIAMLRAMAERAGVESLDGFIRRQLGESGIRTVADCNKVLWALKEMVRRKGGSC